MVLSMNYQTMQRMSFMYVKLAVKSYICVDSALMQMDMRNTLSYTTGTTSKHQMVT